MQYCNNCVAHQSKDGMVTFIEDWIEGCPYCGRDLIKRTDEELTKTATDELVSLKYRVKQG